jgi:hypothetical protein
MLTYVEFQSDRFPPYPGEEDLINPGVWGKRLAEFLRSGLHNLDFETGELIAEDWGWTIPIVNREFRLWIGCSRYEENPHGFLCFIEPHKPYVRKLFRKVNTRGRVAALQRAIDIVLTENAGVRAKHWWTYEEFNNTQRHSPRR